MLAEAAVATILYADTGVTDIVGSNIFSGPAGNNQSGAYICIHQVSVVPQTTKSGSASVDEWHVQVDCYVSDGSTVVLLADAIRRALEFTTGTISTLLGDTVCQGCILLNASRSNGFDPNSRAEGLRRVTQDFQIRLERTP